LDEQSNYSNILWEVSVGDLVRVKNHHFDAYGEEVSYDYGIVIGEKHTGQLTMFPEVDVYLFKQKKTKSFTAGSLEIVSNTR